MKTIYFKIIFNKNNNIYQYGYVEVPEDVEDEPEWFYPEWFYYDQYGLVQPRRFTHHDEIGIRATDTQDMEIITFHNEIFKEIDFINDVILTSEESENRTYSRNNLTIIVNDGENPKGDD